MAKKKAKQKKKNEHAAFFRAHGAFHEPAQGTENGACLIRHEARYIENNSCSYRWQGLEKAKVSPGKDAYNAHDNKAHHIGGRHEGFATRERLEEMQRSSGYDPEVKVNDHRFEKEVETKDGPKVKEFVGVIVKVNNFTTGFAPYGNQVHHVLNNSSLRNGIEEIAKIHYPIRRVIISGLLSAKYNLNHKDNALILPTTDYHCRQTGLPKHSGGHKAYSDEILDLVKEALKPYKKIAEQRKKKKKHDPPEPEEVADSLKEISTTLYAEVMEMAKTNRAAKAAAVEINSLRPKTLFGV